MPSPCLIAVMASGNGSNFQALIDAIEAGQIPNSKICRLIVNRQKAYATQRADKAGISWEYFNLIAGGFQKKGEKDAAQIREARGRYDAALADRILQIEPRPDLIVLAGWMHVFAKSFLDPIQAAGIPIINLHPALPGKSLSFPPPRQAGKYDGAEAIERAFSDFTAGKLDDNKTGIMIHHVIDEVDRGDPILTREIECGEGETLDQLKERIHSHEHELIVEATAKIVRQILASKEQGAR